MWVRLKKSYQYGKKKLPIGKGIRVTIEKGRELISNGIAYEHTEGFPMKKVKTDFFKPKKKKWQQQEK